MNDQMMKMKTKTRGTFPYYMVLDNRSLRKRGNACFPWVMLGFSCYISNGYL